MKTKNRWIALAILIATGLLGGALGSTITLWTLNARSTLAPPPPPAPIEDMPMRMMHHRNLERVVARLEEDLTLTPGQRSAILRDMQELGEAFRQLHETTNQSMRELAEQGRQIILKHLTPEQAQKYEMKSRQRFPRRWQERPENPLRTQPNWRDRKRDTDNESS